VFWNTLTFVSTEAAINATFIRFNESSTTITGVAGIVSSLTLEPLPPALHARHPHSNALGFDYRANLNQSLVIAVVSVSYTNELDDLTVETYDRSLMDAINQDMKELDAFDPFLYLNYAAPYQDPLSSYGLDNVRRLQRLRQNGMLMGHFSIRFQADSSFFLAEGIRTLAAPFTLKQEPPLGASWSPNPY
jgi:hypothetical protein